MLIAFDRFTVHYFILNCFIAAFVNSNLVTDEELTSFSNSSVVNSTHRRAKRSILQLASMIKCIAGCDPMLYKSYGCYCGLHGKGVPVDPIDNCCRKHDHCYSRSTCPHLLVYLMPYQWSCIAPGYGFCIPDYNRGTITDTCSYQLCECDIQFANCISQYKCPRRKPVCAMRRMFFTGID